MKYIINIYIILESLLLFGTASYSFADATNTPKPTNDPAQICNTYLHGHLYKKPTRIKWVSNLGDQFLPSNQGRLNTCWMSAGEHILKPTLLRHGLIKENEELSRDYYSALVMRASMMRDFREDFPLEAYNLGAFFLSDTPHFILEEGIVKKHQFSFPKIWVKTSTGRRYQTDIRHSKQVQENFFKKINYAIDRQDFERFKKTLNRYLGNLDTVKPFFVKPEILNSVNLTIYSTDAALVKKYNLNSSFQILTEVIPTHDIERILQNSLDQGHPILLGVPDLTHFKRMTQFLQAKSIVAPMSDPDGSHHAVTIIGYGYDRDHNIWYKLINNRGLRWGHQGAVAVSGEFVRSQQIGFIAPHIDQSK